MKKKKLTTLPHPSDMQAYRERDSILSCMAPINIDN